MTTSLIYPQGHRITWRSDIDPRPNGAQTGVLAQPWRRYESFPVVLWDGESEPHQCLPECVAPARLPLIAAPAAMRTTNVWDAHRPAKGTSMEPVGLWEVTK